MLINLNGIFKSDFLKNLEKINIKILSIRNSSTLISVKGQKVEIPYILDKNKSYFISFDPITKNFKIKEKECNFYLKKESSLIKNNNIINSFLKKIIDFNEIEIFNRESFLNYFLDNEKKTNEDKENKKNRNFFFKNRKEDFFFIFNIFFLDCPCSLFIKISKDKNVSLVFYLKSKFKNKDKDKIINEIRKNLKNISFEKIVILQEERNNYLKEIEDLLQYNKGINLII